ncbi:MAG: RraA family protein [Bacteroidia bacterium]|nr:RraA family protein [Bacteroidia bacterium]
MRTHILQLSFFAFLISASISSHAQFNRVAMDREYIISLTTQWKGERLPDGRPYVSDNLLERLKKVVLTHAWGGLRRNKFNNQYQGNWMMVNPDKNTVMTGRAITAQYMPQRPDFGDVIRKVGLAEGHGEKAQSNVWPIEMLRDGDVYVADGYAKVNEGTLIGDRLANSIYAKSKRGVIFWGTVRNIQEIKKVEGFNGWILGHHPSSINEMMLTSINAPIRVGDVTVLPGDVVFASPFGTLFFPAYLVAEIVLEAEISNLRHVYGIMRNRAGDWTTGQIDSDYTPEMTKQFYDHLRKMSDSELPMPRKELNEYLEAHK